MAWQAHAMRLKSFQQELDKDKRGEIDGLLTKARLTVIELDFMTACIKSLSLPGAAKADVNKAIEMLGKAEIPSTDVDPSLWGFVAVVLRSESLKSRAMFRP